MDRGCFDYLSFLENWGAPTLVINNWNIGIFSSYIHQAEYPAKQKTALNNNTDLSAICKVSHPYSLNCAQNLNFSHAESSSLNDKICHDECRMRK